MFGILKKYIKYCDIAPLTPADFCQENYAIVLNMRTITWMYNVTLKDRKPSSELRERLGLDSIRNCIRGGRLKWFGHVERCSDDSMMKKFSFSLFILPFDTYIYTVTQLFKYFS